MCIYDIWKLYLYMYIILLQTGSMNTPDKEPTIQAPILPCTVVAETLNASGTVKKSVTYKQIKLILGRNEFR